MRKHGAAIAGLGALLCAGALLAPAATAAVPSVFDGDVGCSVQADQGGIRLCSGETRTFDGTKLDLNLILPPESGGDGPFPTIGVFHGWGGSKVGVNARTRDWAERGYAVFSISDRGWGGSCGAADLPDRLDPTVCGQGYNHLMDTRFEVRDAQHLLGRLADEEIVVGDRIGATGGSYGGGMSMALAALRDRVMMPDSSLVPWTSPAGKPMRIAVAAPEIPWTDLAYSLMPNGRTLDYVADAPYLGPDGNAPIGVLKQSFVAGLYGVGLALSNYALPGTDPQADLTPWYALVNAGEPYDENPQAKAITDEITRHHSSYYIPRGGTSPAPLLISNGWTDDLFPADEAIRFYNRTRSEFPGADVSLYFLDYGHQRGQGKEADTAKLRATQEEWFDHYLKGVGPKPAQGVTALTQTCGDDAASGGPFTAPSWRELAKGEVRFVSESVRTIAPAGGNPQHGQAYDPIAGPGACASTDSADSAGTATYRLPRAEGGGYTLVGSPTVVADISAPSPTSQIAARLLDVAPDGTQTLVARALYRPKGAAPRTPFQLHPNGWRFEDGHTAKLELLPADQPYGRNSNGQGPVTVENLELRLPTLETRGAAGGAVERPAPAIVPEGFDPAPGVRAAGRCETGLVKKGTRRSDRIVGTAGGDRLRGGRGADRISARGGDDCVWGGKGSDRLRGGKGEDRIHVGHGKRDRVDCGPGKDVVIADRKDKVRRCEKIRRLSR